MNRVLISGIFASAMAMAVAQSNFTIVRPADGAKVRETVRLLFPKNSVPMDKGGYVGIYVGGKFLEAIRPKVGNTYLYYDLDTKDRKIADGPVTIEAVLYQELSDRPRILDRSSIQVNVQNSASINIPSNGLNLRYRFRRGQQWVYKVEQRLAMNTMSESQANSGGISGLLTGADVETIRLLFSVDNVYPNGDGLVRLQALPEKGKDYAIMSLESDPTPRKYWDYQMAPVYMRLKNTGAEVFGAVPRYFPLSGSQGELTREDLYAAWPLPVLPTQPKKPGMPWQSQFQIGIFDLEKADELVNLTTKDGIIARAELLGVEWEMGHPCARIRHTLETRTPKLPNLPPESRVLNATKIQEDIYFALDLGTVAKMTREYTIDVKEQVNIGGGTGGGGNRPGAGNSAPGRPMGSGSAGGSTGGGGDSKDNVHHGGDPRIGIKQRGGQGRPGGPPQPGPGGPGQFGPPGRPMGSGTAGQAGGAPGQQGGSGGGRTVNRINRLTIQLSFTLEQ